MKPKLKTEILQASHTMPNTMEAYLDIAKQIETVQKIGESSSSVTTVTANPLQESLTSMLGLNTGQLSVPTVRASTNPISQVTQAPINVTAGTLANAIQTAATNKILTNLTAYQKKNRPASGSVVGVVESTAQASSDQNTSNQLVLLLAGLTGSYLMTPVQSQGLQMTSNQSGQQPARSKGQNQISDTKQDQSVKCGFDMFTKVMATLGGNDDRKFRQTDDLVQALKQRDKNFGQRWDRFGDYEPLRQPLCHYCQKPGHFERQCLQRMNDRQQWMEHGSSCSAGNGGRGRGQYGLGGRGGGSFSGQGRKRRIF